MPRGTDTMHDLYLTRHTTNEAYIDLLDADGVIEWSGRLRDLVEQNDFDDDERARLDTIASGEQDKTTLGGGASPCVTVRRRSESDLERRERVQDDYASNTFGRRDD